MAHWKYKETIGLYLLEHEISNRSSSLLAFSAISSDVLFEDVIGPVNKCGL